MKILCLKPFLKSATIHPSVSENEQASNLLTHILFKEGHEIFVLPWEDEKVWNERPFCVDEDYSYATALPTLFFPRITDLTKTILKSFTQKNAFTHPNKHIWNLIESSFYQKKIFLQKAMSSAKADLLHSYNSDPNLIDLYRRQQYKTPIILTHFPDEIHESLTKYDFVIFTDENTQIKAVKEFPDLKDKSSFINYSVEETNRENFTEKHLSLYSKISDSKKSSYKDL